MTIIATLGEYIDDINDNFAKLAGAIAFIVMCFNRAAKLTPFHCKNKYLQWVCRKAYYIFAVLGMNVPDIAGMRDGKIVTTQEAEANKTFGG